MQAAPMRFAPDAGTTFSVSSIDETRFSSGDYDIVFSAAGQAITGTVTFSD